MKANIQAGFKGISAHTVSCIFWNFSQKTDDKMNSKKQDDDKMEIFNIKQFKSLLSASCFICLINIQV